MEESKMVLRTEDLVKKYGKRTVVSHVSIDVKQGEIVGLLGPNGAGKTTSFYMTVGLITPNEGRIFLDDLEITKYPVYKRAQTGIGYLAQEASVFRQMSVEDNIASELGTMRVTQQIDALEIMGINSANYLILPKITAMVTVIPILVTFSIFAGIIGAFCTCWFAGVMNAVDLEYGLQYMFVEWFIWAGIIKSLFFAFIIASVSAFFGYTVDGGSIAVGKASTDAVVSSSVLILFADLILTKLLMG